MDNCDDVFCIPIFGVNSKGERDMIKKGLAVLSSVVLVVFIQVMTASASVPQTINYQGYLTNSSGVPINTTVDLTFSLYDVSTGGAALWTEIHYDVAVANGIYSVILGGSVSNPAPITLTFDVPYYLGVKVNTDPEMAPRQALSAAPYAMRSKAVDSVPCIPGDFHFCYSGPSGTLNVGTCKAGTRTCSQTGTFGTCVGEITPAAGDACNGTDDNCNGILNDGCNCLVGTTLDCGVGACSRSTSCTTGQETCVAGDPVQEICGNGIDDDCNGQVDDGCTFANGTACIDGQECTSGICVDGVCCGTPCSGLCESCSISTPGICSPVPMAQDPDNECPSTGTCAPGYCSGSRTCFAAVNGTDCGTCMSCNGFGSCMPNPTNHSDCGLCQMCSGGGSCMFQPTGQDIKSECPTNCNGSGACQ